MARLMLYKKVHRQYLREFRIGRRFKDKYDNCIDEITGKPYTYYIMVIFGWKVGV